MALKVRISWSDSAIVASSAARYSAGLARCRQAPPRRGCCSRVSGVFRSWAMLSETCFSPSFSVGDPGQHGVEVFGQAVELVAGAGHRQPAAQIAAHDAAARLGDAVDALQRAPADEEPDQPARRAPSCRAPTSARGARRARKRSGSPRSRPTSTIIWLGSRSTSGDRRVPWLRPRVGARPARPRCRAFVGCPRRSAGR